MSEGLQKIKKNGGAAPCTFPEAFSGHRSPGIPVAPYEGARRTEEGQRQGRKSHHKKEVWTWPSGRAQEKPAVLCKSLLVTEVTRRVNQALPLPPPAKWKVYRDHPLSSTQREPEGVEHPVTMSSASTVLLF